MKKHEMSIGGHAVGADHYQEIRNPANGEVVGLCPIGSSTQLDQAVYAARQAFASWSRTDDNVRQNACRVIARIITAHLPELSVLLTQEQGKPFKGMGSEFELGGCADLKPLTDRVCQSLAAYYRQVPMYGGGASRIARRHGTADMWC